MEKAGGKKTWTLRFRAVDVENFNTIVNGAKSVETRAATAKYRAVKKGDALTIVCGAKRVTRTVKKVKVFPSVAALVAAVRWKTIMPRAASLAEVRKTYDGYPGYREKLKKNGVIAFWI